jgi:hypothetical protein
MQYNARVRGSYYDIEEVANFEILPCLGQSLMQYAIAILAHTALHCGMSARYFEVACADM